MAKAAKPVENPVAGFKHKVVEQLEPMLRPITDCQPHPENARKHKLPLIARSLMQHGQRTPIVVQASTGYVVKGNGTWTAAAQLLGWTQLAQSWQDLSDDQAMAYLLADNKASDGAEYDNVKLAKALGRMSEGPGLLDTLWGDEELEDLVEGEAGLTIMAAQGTDAEYAILDPKAKLEGVKDANGTGTVRMMQVPVLLTQEDHAAFVGWVKTLQKLYGLTSTVRTIFEAVRRQGEAEGEAAAVGRNLAGEARATVRRELVVDLKALVSTMPNPSKDWVLSQLELAQPEPVVTSPLRPDGQLPGQVGLDDMVDIPDEPVIRASELRTTIMDQPVFLEPPKVEDAFNLDMDWDLVSAAINGDES